MSAELKKAFLDEAERSLEASSLAETGKIQEKVGFLCYHAFESLGGASAASRSLSYSMSHRRKINQFVTSVRGRSYGITVANLAISLYSLRNLMLYPRENPDGTVTRPKDHISLTNATKLRKRVSGLFRLVKRDFS